MDFQGNTVHYDATNPAAREYVWQKAKKNYYDKGIKVFWLDEAEPEYSVYDLIIIVIIWDQMYRLEIFIRHYMQKHF